MYPTREHLVGDLNCLLTFRVYGASGVILPPWGLLLLPTSVARGTSQRLARCSEPVLAEVARGCRPPPAAKKPAELHEKNVNPHDFRNNVIVGLEVTVCTAGE